MESLTKAFEMDRYDLPYCTVHDQFQKFCMMQGISAIESHIYRTGVRLEGEIALSFQLARPIEQQMKKRLFVQDLLHLFLHFSGNLTRCQGCVDGDIIHQVTEDDIDLLESIRSLIRRHFLIYR